MHVISSHEPTGDFYILNKNKSYMTSHICGYTCVHVRALACATLYRSGLCALVFNMVCLKMIRNEKTLVVTPYKGYYSQC